MNVYVLFNFRDTMTITAGSVHDNDEQQEAEETENGLMGILSQWKEHLFAQKNELQDYYNR